MAIDTHAHLFDKAFDFDRDEVIQRIMFNKIEKVVVVGFSHETNYQAYELSLKYPFMYPTAGLHPSDANDYYEEDIRLLEEFVINHKVYAIGECGLDYYWHKDNKEKQKWLFESQIKLAIKYNLPLIIHSRDAISDTFEMLNKYANQVKFVMHCYSGSWEMAERFMKIGGYISLGGPVTFKNAKEPKIVAKNIDINRLMIETDCPYLAPMPMRGKRNDTSYVLNILTEIANLKEMNKDDLEKVLNRNSIEFFGLK